MYQVLFRIPLGWLPEALRGYVPESIPIYGFGMMLFIAFIVCTWLAGRRAEQEGIAREFLQDLAIWIFAGGIIGARFTFLLVNDLPLWQFFKIWDGGLVFYGSAIGGATGYFLAYLFVIRKHGISSWKLADVIAPAVALGLCLGRIGCLLNGCCYGNVAGADCPAIHFPLSSPPRYDLVQKGYQTAAGFTMSTRAVDERTVGAVDPDSPAAAAGLRAGDVLVAVDGHPVVQAPDLWDYLVRDWPRGKAELSLTVQRGTQEIDLPAFAPRTLGLHPTQLYSSVGAFLLFLLLMAYTPFRRRDGEVMVLLMLGYPLIRFLEEALRNDTPPLPAWTGMTLSQNGSLLLFAVALGFAYWMARQPIQYDRTPRPGPNLAGHAVASY